MCRCGEQSRYIETVNVCCIMMLFSSAGCYIALGVITVLAFFVTLILGIIITLCWMHGRTHGKLIGTFQEHLTFM